MEDGLGGIGGLRLAASLAGLGLALFIEAWRPFHGRAAGSLRRDTHNVALWGAGAALLQLLPFFASLGVAEIARETGVGLLNHIAAPNFFEIAVTVLVLDAATYGLHRLYHGWRPLWRLHRVHHSDGTLSATTGVRFHPGEVLVSTLVRVPVIAALGAPVVGIAAFEVILLAASQLQHADVRLPDRLDAAMRRVLVSPNYHRVHHSRLRVEADSNFGTLLTCWDRLLGTARSEAPERIAVGLPERGAHTPGTLFELLSMPFARASRRRA